jgi:pimeloyl-ACP methyl ester carboxylesterase
VVSWAHGTTGLAAPCAPSRAGGAAPAFGVEGVRVATDYVGLGPVGERHPYLSGPSGAHGVIDAVRAARALPGSGAGARWVAVGHSQGGHAALFTSELAADHAPELELLGTAVVAPAAALTETFGPADVIVPHMVGVMALYGLAADHPELDPHDYVSEEVVAVEDVVDEACSDVVVATMAPIPVEAFYDRHPLETEPARSIVEANDPGGVASPSPLLLVHGTADTWVVPARVDHVAERLCSVGQVTERLEVPDATHDTVVPLAAEAIGSWFAARIAGDPPVDDCA